MRFESFGIVPQYTCSVVDSIPNDHSVFAFPPNQHIAGSQNDSIVAFGGVLDTEGIKPLFVKWRSEQRENILLHVTASTGADWYGQFAPGQLASHSCIYAGPSDKQVCVVFEGAGYIVDAQSPMVWTMVDLDPITAVYRVPGQDVLVFIGFSDVVAYSSSGVKWRAAGVSLDGIQVESVSAERITGVAETDEFHSAIPFSIDSISGSIRGGYVGSLRGDTYSH